MVTAPTQVRPKRTIKVWRACDKCGYSGVDNQPISRAKYQVDFKSGTLYFCNHHAQEYWTTLMAAGYGFIKIYETVDA